MLPSHAPFVSLPQEILLKILSYLGPRDLCRISQTHPLLAHLAYDSSLWQSLHPVRWANGHWQFYFPSLDKADVRINGGILLFDDLVYTLFYPFSYSYHMILLLVTTLPSTS